MTTNPVLAHLVPTRSPSGTTSPVGRVGRRLVGLVLALVGIVGVLRTFDPVHLSAAQAAFLVLTVAGVALTELHIRD